MAKNANFYEKHQNVSNPWFLAHLDVGIAYLTKICLFFDPIDPFLLAKNANFYEKHQNVSNPWFLAHLDNGIAYLGKIS